MKDLNLVVCVGRLTRPPEPRELPSGDHLVSYELAIASTVGPRKDTVPVIWWGAPSFAGDYKAGDVVVVIGNVQRRFYRAGGATLNRTEVKASSVMPVGNAGQTAATLEEATSLLREALT